MAERLTANEYWRRRERDELAARRSFDRGSRDQMIDQALIAWMAGGASVPWEQFRREWIRTHGE